MRDLAFIWPTILGLLVLLLIVVLIYQRQLKGHSKQFASYPSLGLVGLATQKLRKRRQFSTILYLCALFAACFALARPTTKLLQPDNLSGIMFAIETGRSMQAWDIEPTRLAAAQAAAKELIDGVPSSIKVGLATFSSSGVVNVPLTTDHQKVKEGIDLLSAGGDFAFTYGIMTSLKALPEELPEDGVPGAIVLFSHGHDNSGNNPTALAQEAAERGIPIHTIGVGTHGNNFSEDILQVIAELSGGKYYPIFSTEDLQEAHKDLGKIIRLRPRTTEITALPALAAALLLSLSLIAAQFRRKVF